MSNPDTPTVWFRHDGGKCPVDPVAFVEVDLGDVTLVPDRASVFDWHKVQEYRVISIEEFLAGAFGYPLGYDEDDLDDEPPLVDDEQRERYAFNYTDLRDMPKPDAPTDHYRQGDIECIDAIRAALTDEEWRGYCKGNVLKYTWREKHKGGDGSLLKAQDYLRWALAGKAEDKR
jgi:hypothetical protein